MKHTLETKLREVTKAYEGKPVALSGGIDSSVLAALIKPRFAITVRLPDGKHDELQYAQTVADSLGIKHVVVELDDARFDEVMQDAVRIIGRPIPHFNIFPLYEMYRTLSEMGETELVLGDGPDETMCGYARDLIIAYLYHVYECEAFEHYKPLIDKILPPIWESLSRVTGRDVDEVRKAITGGTIDQVVADVDCGLMRKDMDDMSNKLAEHFGITNLRPYQDNESLDNYMRNLPLKEKVRNVEYGKYALRKIAEKHLPKEIAWRKVKVGGPVYPVNKLKGWTETDGEFGKGSYLAYQRSILDGTH